MKTQSGSVLLAVIALFLGTSAFAAPCPTNILASCTTSQGGNISCLDLISNQVPMDQFQASCQQGQGTFSTSPCSKTNLVGSCNIGQQGSFMLLRMYSPIPGPYVEMICAQSGGTVCQ